MDNALKTQIIKLLDGLYGKERTNLIWELIEKCDIQIFTGDEEKGEESFSIILTENSSIKEENSPGDISRLFRWEFESCIISR